MVDESTGWAIDLECLREAGDMTVIALITLTLAGGWLCFICGAPRPVLSMSLLGQFDEGDDR